MRLFGMRLFALFPLIVGTFIQAIAAFGMSTGSIGVFHLVLYGWLCLPYLLLFFSWLKFAKPTDQILVLTAGISILVADLLVLRSVFFHPVSSTASLGFVFSPLIDICCVIPVGIGLGLLIRRIHLHLIPLRG